MRRVGLIALAVCAVAAVPAHADSVPVAVIFQAFSPSQIDALPGDTIQWSNGSERTHTVTADDGSFDSGPMTSGTFHHTFDHPGEFTYHCRIHPQRMTGTVVVQQ